ncbi:NUDIX hydrolase [Dyadobacter sp. CY326]|uniref:NUDIX hydrolase n=1 Tax=Dyadobacter sp. CY326 TaxID=2907300 RepID=UPI001F4749A6|nr:NUDIX hydrolase [Dyadobacter sp. CY326]MCE7066876.1 NUDIX hydrolase [Dyadobacter sp. CY326]
MKRNSLLSLLNAYTPENGLENEMYLATIDFVKSHEDCFERSLLIGHVTASGLVLSADGNSVLLMHHQKLGHWLQPGGHCDGDPDTERVARKEIWEETGIQQLELYKEGIFDVDIHLIPERKGLPAHNHYDIRYAFKAAEGQDIVVNDESLDVQWVPLQDVAKLNDSESVVRMIRKVTA